jgi:hypothetical protein
MASAEAEELEDAEHEGFPPAERKVVTQSYDLSDRQLARALGRILACPAPW